MLGRVLKKDMSRKRGVNFILFLFIIVSTIFLASSVNNMLVVSNATTYFMDKAKIPDEFIGGRHIEGDTSIEDWLKEQKDLVKDYNYQESLMIGNKNVEMKADGESWSNYETNSTVYLQSVPDDYVKVFDCDGNDVTIKNGEVALIASEAKKHDLKVGDQIRIDNGTTTETYKIAVLLKDALYGGDMANMIRFIFSDDDYEVLQDGTSTAEVDNYFVQTDDIDAFEKEFSQQAFASNPNTISRDTVKLLYVMDMVIAGMLTAIGVCLILIAVLVLRFTIVFTIQEEYREIGIMKGIGIRDFGIKQIYLVKYLAIVVCGSVIGCIASFPVGDLMLKSVSNTMLMESSANNGVFNILCAVAVVMIVMLLCYLSMRRLNKMSVMDAIRSGETGERYQKKSVLRLDKSKKLPVPLFLAINDILSNVKQYIVLLLVFAVGIVLIIVPINTMNTMKSSEMSDQFLLDRDADLFLSGIEDENGLSFTTNGELEKALDKVRDKFEEKGYHAKISAVTMSFIPFSSDENKSTTPLLTMQPIDSDGEYLSYSEGSAPKLENEIALSKKVLKLLDLEIGDTVNAVIDGKDRSFLITGTYQDYCQLGTSARLNSSIDLKDHYIYNYWSIPLYVDSDLNTQELKAQLEEDFPDYKFQTAQSIVNTNVGGIIDSIDNMRIWLVILMAGINIFITILMMKMFMMREKGQIAMLRSVGFKNRSIRQWQTLRIIGLLAIAEIVAIPLSKIMDMTVLKGIFGIMGADIRICVIPLQAYIIYPAIMLVSIMIAAAYASSSVRKIDIREMSNME